jgi:oligopeptide/dipeptide ABC transporter ATP-binding protein
VLVMYAGQVVEGGPPDRVFADPLHPYTRGLARACPRPPTSARPSHPSAAIPGSPPDPRRREPGCAFEPRCGDRRPRCRERPPSETWPAAARHVRCVLHGG